MQRYINLPLHFVPLVLTVGPSSRRQKASSSTDIKEGSAPPKEGSSYERLRHLSWHRLFHCSATDICTGSENRRSSSSGEISIRDALFTFTPRLSLSTSTAALMKINRDFFRATCFSSTSCLHSDSCRVPSVCHDLFTNVDKRFVVGFLPILALGSVAWREKEKQRLD